MFTCFRTRRRIGAWIDGALGETEGRATGAHVEACARCSVEAASIRKLHVVLTRALPIAEPRDWTGFFPGIVRGVQDAKRVPARPARARWRPRVAFGGALVAAALVALVMWPAAQDPFDRVTVSSAETGQSSGTVMVYTPPERDLAVVWVFDSE